MAPQLVSATALYVRPVLVVVVVAAAVVVAALVVVVVVVVPVVLVSFVVVVVVAFVAMVVLAIVVRSGRVAPDTLGRVVRAAVLTSRRVTPDTLVGRVALDNAGRVSPLRVPIVRVVRLSTACVLGRVSLAFVDLGLG